MRSKNLILFTISLIVLTSVVVYSADAAGIPKKAISTVARFLESDLPTTSVFTDQASTYTAGKQTFLASSSGSAGINIPTGSDPTSPAQGDIWLNSDTLKYRGTSTHSLVTSAITSLNGDASSSQNIVSQSGNTTVTNSTGQVKIGLGPNVLNTGGSAQTISKQLTINSGVLGGNLNVGSNALTNSGHLITIPTNTGTVLLTNGSGSSLTNIVRSITGTANNLTSSASTGAVILNLGSNVVTTGGSAQTISKPVNLSQLNASSSMVDNNDATKKLNNLLSGSTTGTTLTLRTNQTTSQGLNFPAIRETETLAIKPQINFSASSNKTGTTSLGGVMLGDGVTLTPQVTGRVVVIASGYMTTATNNDGCFVQIRQGTGGSPGNGVALTGTAFGSNIKFAGSTTAKTPFSVNVQITGLTLGTKNWFELAQGAVGGAVTCTIFNVNWTVEEI